MLNFRKLILSPATLLKYLKNLLGFSFTFPACSILCPLFAPLIAFLNVFLHFLYLSRDLLDPDCLNLMYVSLFFLTIASTSLINLCSLNFPALSFALTRTFYPCTVFNTLLKASHLPDTPLSTNRLSQLSSASSCLIPTKLALPQFRN